MFDPRIALIQVREKYAALAKEAVSTSWVQKRVMDSAKDIADRKGPRAMYASAQASATRHDLSRATHLKKLKSLDLNSPAWDNTTSAVAKRNAAHNAANEAVNEARVRLTSTPNK